MYLLQSTVFEMYPFIIGSIYLSENEGQIEEGAGKPRLDGNHGNFFLNNQVNFICV